MAMVNAQCGQTVRIGFETENKRTQVRFDLSDIMAEFPGGTAVLTIRRPGDEEATVSTSVTMDGTALVWNVTAWECERRGFLYAQVIYAVGDVVAKTKIYRFQVNESLMGEADEPEGWEDWVGELVEAAADTRAAVESYDEMTAAATGLPAGSTPTAVIDRTGENPVLELGIPAGNDGYTPQRGTDYWTEEDQAAMRQDIADDLTAARQAINDEKVLAVGAVETAGTTQVGLVTDEGTAQKAAVVAQGQATIASIPSDYTTLSNDVDDLKSAIDYVTDKMQVIETPASDNLWNKDIAQVGYLHKNGTVYTGGSYDNFVYGSIGEVSEGDVLNFYKWYNQSSITTMTVQWVVCYDSNGDVLSDSGTSAVTTFTVPSGVASVSITIVGSENQIGMVLKNNSSAPTEYIPYGEPSAYYVATPDFIHSAFEEEAEEMQDDIDGMKTATSSDVGKALSPKTVEDGEVTEWQFIEAGGSPSGDYVETKLMKLCDLVEVPKSPNLWDDAHKQPGWYHKNGNIYNYADYYYFGIGKVNTGDVISCYYAENSVVYPRTMYAVVCLDSNGNRMADVSADSVITFIVPSGVDSIVVTLYKPQETVMIVNNVQQPSGFIPYYEAYSAYIATRDFIRNAMTSDIILNVPSKIYAVVGVELNVYFENITEEWTKYHWDVTCTKGKQMQRGFTITPVAGDIGEYPITIRASVDDETYAEVSSTLVVASASGASGISIIVLGDSTTDNGMAVTKIHTDFENASTTIQTLGTRGTSPNNHEGRSGWKASDYLTVQSRGGVDNPFYNPSTATFDAAYYFTNSGVSVPDWFFINLGINDVFGYVSDAELNVWIPRIIGYYDTIVESLQTAEPGMKIGICITIPPNDSQDAFGKAYACGQTRDRAKRNNAIWGATLIEHFADKESEGIYLVPIHVNLDTVYNMGMETLPVNARNTSVTYESPIGNGGVHPVESGYWQIADVYTAFLKANAE